MASDTVTRNQQRHGNLRPDRNPLFRRLPPSTMAMPCSGVAWPRWTVGEAANLLVGCVPMRELFLRGAQHHELDNEVVDMENRIRAALDEGLTRVSTKKYFDETWIASAEILDWAYQEGIEPPKELVSAWQEVSRERATHGYRTRAMLAVAWVVERYWEGADLRDAPTRGEIVTALLQAFPELTVEECEMVEHITRHPAAVSEG
ncbi:MAG: hypothetical protein U5O39_13700 [Gammaproteobacteria bacterium]|nr:hypothetical protein [Gammaproteobacteria bacterium]